MKKEAKVEYGITITKPWSSEMYAHNEEVADWVRTEVKALWDFAINEFQEDAGESFMSDIDWSTASEILKDIQTAVTCYRFASSYDVAEVAERVMQELEDAPLYHLKSIAEELGIELEKGFIGFNS